MFYYTIIKCTLTSFRLKLKAPILFCHISKSSFTLRINFCFNFFLLRGAIKDLYTLHPFTLNMYKNFSLGNHLHFLAFGIFNILSYLIIA